MPLACGSPAPRHSGASLPRRPGLRALLLPGDIRDAAICHGFRGQSPLRLEQVAHQDVCQEYQGDDARREREQEDAVERLADGILVIGLGVRQEISPDDRPEGRLMP